MVSQPESQTDISLKCSKIRIGLSYNIDMVKREGLSLSNFKIYKQGKIVMSDGREVVATRPPYRLHVDRGRPVGNQAGLPPTAGIDHKPGVGYSSIQDRKRVVRHSGRFGGNNTILDAQQRATEQVETIDGSDQREAGDRFEEAMSRDQRMVTKRIEKIDGDDQRKAEAVFNRQVELGEYDH